MIEVSATPPLVPPAVRGPSLAALPAPGSAPAARAVRVLVFVEARGGTDAIRNLLDLAGLATSGQPSIEFEIATCLRSRGDAWSDDVLAAEAAARALGVRVHLLQERRASALSLVAQARALLGARGPDVVETRHVRSHLLAALAGVDGRRWVAFHPGYTPTSLRDRAGNLLDLWTLRCPSLVITPCETVARQLAGRVPRRRVAVLHDAVRPVPEDPDASRRLRRQLGVRGKDALVVAVGRLSKGEGHAVLLSALAQPHLSGSGRATVALVGEGPERGALAALAARLGVADRVRFVGHQADPWPYYHAADIVALPSDRGGSSGALIDAMAAGKAIVATRVGGVPHLIEDGRSGLLVPPRCPVAMARALSDGLCVTGLAGALGRQAREVALARFSVEGRAARLAALYRSLGA